MSDWQKFKKKNCLILKGNLETVPSGKISFYTRGKTLVDIKAIEKEFGEPLSKQELAELIFGCMQQIDYCHTKDMQKVRKDAIKRFLEQEKKRE